jgi:hypothetical protein
VSAPVIVVRIVGGISETPGLPCGVPGLAIVPAVGAPDIPVIVHVRSGLAIAGFPSGGPEAALACAQALGGLADWNETAGELRPVVDSAEELIARWGGVRDVGVRAVAAELDDIRPGGAS